MRKFITFCFLAFVYSAVCSQDISGEWQGHFSYDEPYTLGNQETSIALSIKQNPAKTYTIFSYSRLKTKNGKDTTVVCKVSFKKRGKNSILLEEQIEEYDSDFPMYQKMFLKLRKRNGRMELFGRWIPAKVNTSVSGTVVFQKVQ